MLGWPPSLCMAGAALSLWSEPCPPSMHTWGWGGWGSGLRNLSLPTGFSANAPSPCDETAPSLPGPVLAQADPCSRPPVWPSERHACWYACSARRRRWARLGPSISTCRLPLPAAARSACQSKSVARRFALVVVGPWAPTVPTARPRAKLRPFCEEVGWAWRATLALQAEGVLFEDAGRPPRPSHGCRSGFAWQARPRRGAWRQPQSQFGPTPQSDRDPHRRRPSRSGPELSWCWRRLRSQSMV